MLSRYILKRLGGLLLFFSIGQVACADQPAIAIVIDDMGNHQVQGRAALDLPGKLTYAFLPYTPYASSLAHAAHRRGKEIMLHLPMDSHDGGVLGPGALNLHMTEAIFKKTLQDDLEAVPHVAGMNNHMGSLLTRHPGAMAWVMETLQQRAGLYFIDSRTTHETVAQLVAEEHGVPNTRRDVFLDNDRDPVAIAGQFRLLLAKAREQGYAVGIGHPYPETVKVLESELADLENRNVRLIRASELIRLQRSSDQWQELSYPSPKVARNWKQ